MLALTLACTGCRDEAPEPHVVEPRAEATPPEHDSPDAPATTGEGDETVTDDENGLVWQRTVDGAPRVHEDANRYCDELVLSGELDWRLPTIAELESIVSDAVAGPALDADAFPNTPADPDADDWFWSSSPSAAHAGTHWRVRAYDGASSLLAATKPQWTRCVSAGTGGAAPAGSYAIQADSVRDTRTGLTWQRLVDPDIYTQERALDYCARLSLAGFEDWRLPTRAELLSIADRSRADPAIDPQVFPQTPSNRFWTSSPYVGRTGGAWLVVFTLGTSINDYPTAADNVRCVR